jgi:hypothetical protein
LKSLVKVAPDPNEPVTTPLAPDEDDAELLLPLPQAASRPATAREAAARAPDLTRKDLDHIADFLFLWPAFSITDRRRDRAGRGARKARPGACHANAVSVSYSSRRLGPWRPGFTGRRGETVAIPVKC